MPMVKIKTCPNNVLWRILRVQELKDLGGYSFISFEETVKRKIYLLHIRLNIFF